MRIGFTYYDGDEPQTEGDEYIEIVNDGPEIDVAGWSLQDDDGNRFSFPSFVMQTGQKCRVYTNRDVPEHCGFNFGSSEAIWGNSGDVVMLVDPTGAVVSQESWSN